MQNSEYSPGSVLHLKSVGHDLSIEATVTHAYRPFTMSPVLRVSLAVPGSLTGFFDGADTPTEMILKLYDRRYFTNVREQFQDTDPIWYTSDKQDAYAEYLLEGEKLAVDFDDFEAVGEVEFSDGEFESYVAYWATKFYETELQTYEHLQDLQGNRIPRLYFPVFYDQAHGIPDHVPGLLLEYVPSLSLRQFIRHDPPYPPTLVRRVCDDAVKLIREVNDYEVLNEDVRLDNVLVRLSSLENIENTSPPPCVLIDLSNCRRRRPDESEKEWARAKWSQDEDGAVGLVAQREVRQEYLGKKEESGEVWTYKLSLRYCRESDDEDSE